jgi:hypothetical protein
LYFFQFFPLKMEILLKKCELLTYDIVTKRNQRGVNWGITWLHEDCVPENIDSIYDKILGLRHIDSFVFQMETLPETEENYIHIAITFNTDQAKPVPQILKIFPESHLQIQRDIKSWRSFCCKTYYRTENTEPQYYNLDPKFISIYRDKKSRDEPKKIRLKLVLRIRKH